VWYANDPSLGERNGKRTGRPLNIAANVAEEIKHK